MSYLLTCNILIDNKYRLNFAKEVEINSSWQTLGDTCIIKIPTKGVLVSKGENGQNVERFSFGERFETGMSIEVNLGYDGNNKPCFVGYIKAIKPTIPFELHCEDAVYELKREKAISKVFTGTLKGLLSEYLSGVEIAKNIPDVTLSNFVLNKVTPAEILEKVKDSYGLSAYYKPASQTLFVGLPYSEFENYEPVYFDFQKNVVSDSLEYRKAEDVKIKVKAISILKNNQKIEIEVGDADGEIRTLHTYNETDTKKLRSWAESQLGRLKYEGYSGNITAFGLPYVRHSSAVSLYDERYEERAGQVYIVDSVRTTWGTSGFRRLIELGKKV
jgi:hypothetical protein